MTITLHTGLRQSQRMVFTQSRKQEVEGLRLSTIELKKNLSLKSINETVLGAIFSLNDDHARGIRFNRYYVYLSRKKH
jgi:hypothetical protein